MTNFRSEETRRHDGMAEVEGSKWFKPLNHENPFGPTKISWERQSLSEDSIIGFDFSPT
jgi:hypothetical protein